MVLAFWVMSLASARSKDIASLAITPPPKGGLCAGESLPLEVVATDGSGKTRKLKFGRKPEVSASWEIGAVTQGGELKMPEDPRAGWGKVGKLTVTSTLDPSKTAEIAVPLRFDCTTVVDLSGREGDTGTQGSDGGGGNPNGTDGTPGQVGEVGHDGPEVHVRLTLVEEPLSHGRIVQAEIQVPGSDEVRYAAFLAGSGELVVASNGGDGGKGGNGGTGGEGAPGDKGSGNFGGMGGSGGNAGNGGNGGRGGMVTVFVDESAAGYLKSLVIQNAGGSGGMPGAGGDMGLGGKAGGQTVGRNGFSGNDGPSGPPPEVQGAVIAPLW